MNRLDEIVNRRNTYCAKYDMYDKIVGRCDVTHLGVADSDLKAPIEIVNKMCEVANHAIYGYTEINDDFAISIARYIKNMFGISVPQEEIVYCPRINIALGICVNKLTNRGDNVIINTPAYSPLYSQVIKNGRNIIESPLKQVGNRYMLDFENLESIVNSKTKMLILCSPHNPTSTVFYEDEIKKLEDFCIKHKLLIFSDEIHSSIIKEGVKFISTLSLSEEFLDKLIYTNSPAKAFNIAGVIASYIIVKNSEIRDKIKAGIDEIGMHNPNIFGLNALITSYNNCMYYIKDLNDYVEKNETLLREYFAKYMPKFKIFDRDGTYLLWIDYSNFNITEDDIKKWFINDVLASVYTESSFTGTKGKFIRLNIALQTSRLEVVLKNMVKAYDKIDK